MRKYFRSVYAGKKSVGKRISVWKKSWTVCFITFEEILLGGSVPIIYVLVLLNCIAGSASSLV